MLGRTLRVKQPNHIDGTDLTLNESAEWLTPDIRTADEALLSL